MLHMILCANAQIIKAELVASGLTCSMCSFATQKQLKTLDFVDSIGTDLNRTTFLLYFKKKQPVDISQLKNKVEAAGFSVATLLFTFHAKKNLKLDELKSFEFENVTYIIVNGDSKKLEGDLKFKVLDKGFVTSKVFNKNKPPQDKSKTSIPSVSNINKVFHVTLL